MDRARVSQSIILTVIMIMGSLSYGLNDLTVQYDELTEEEPVAHSASNNTYDPLAIQTSYYANSENPGYIGTTYDDRVIVYSEEQDSTGDFNIAISVYSYPEQGFEQPAGRSPLAIQIPEMNIDREISLPTNFSKMRLCTPILHPDDYISLACSTYNEAYANTPLRLDFASSNHTINNLGGSMFLWDGNDSLVNFIPLNGTAWGSGLSQFKPKFYDLYGQAPKTTNNFTYLGKTRIVASGNFELNGTSYSCPTSMSIGCSALFESNRDGNISNILFVGQNSNTGECGSLHIDDVTDSGLIELKLTSQLCYFRLANNTLLFSTGSSAHGAWAVLDSNFSHVRDFPMKYNCGNAAYNGLEIHDIETTHNGTYYFAHTNKDCVGNNGLTTIHQTIHGSNVTNLNGGSWTKAIISLGFLNANSTSFTSSPSIGWRYTWAVDGSGNPMSQGVSKEIKFFDGDKLYWAGSWAHTYTNVLWNAELSGGSPPNLNPSTTGAGNSMASIFSMNGTWLAINPEGTRILCLTA